MNFRLYWGVGQNGCPSYNCEPWTCSAVLAEARGEPQWPALPRVAALDMWELATSTYKLNFPDAVTYWMKASELSPQRLLKDVGQFELFLRRPNAPTTV